MVETSENSLWVEKYRPRTLEDVILPSDTKEIFRGFVQKGDIPNLILHSRKGGTGKTTTARAICADLGYDVLFINASLENGIDTLRTKIANFVSSVSLTGNKKVVLFDECDALNTNTVQPALRAFIEQYSKHCRFIFTCNYLNKLLPPLISRCTVVEFGEPKKERRELIKQTLMRLFEILKKEGITYNEESVLKLLLTHYPDVRRAINELQRYSASGHIDDGVSLNLDQDNFTSLVKMLKEHKFTEMRRWVANNSDISDEKIFGYFYENCDKFIMAKSIPQLIITTADYQYKTNFVADKSINIVAYLTEIMSNCEFLDKVTE